MIVPFIVLLLVFVLITYFIVTAVKKKNRGEDLGENVSGE